MSEKLKQDFRDAWFVGRGMFERVVRDMLERAEGDDSIKDAIGKGILFERYEEIMVELLALRGYEFEDYLVEEVSAEEYDYFCELVQGMNSDLWDAWQKLT